MRKLLLALLLFATPALATMDMGLPPPKYDIGGDTIEEAMANFRAVFGDEVPVKAVGYDQAKGPCDEISWPYYHKPWPDPEPGNVLYGCSIAADGYQAIIYTDDAIMPGKGVVLFRHEVGHLLGWGPYHERY